MALALLVKSVPAFAAANLSISPLTWNVIGLDSNNVNVGPNHFPVGARVCNIGDASATNVTSAFIWDSANALIDLRPGTFSDFNSIPVPSLAPTDCYDFYYEVEVTRNAAAYDTTRRYHITTTADGLGTVSTPTPRELYVEHLVSQARNHVLDIKLDGTSIPAGGTMALLVGQTYTIDLIGSTATNGYEQAESFLTLPNTLFQVLSVTTTYTADTSPSVDNPNDKLYGDACVWENDPTSPYYRSCFGVGKVGGGVAVSYVVKILQVPSAPLTNPEPISTLIYDFSGSSYHYNADIGPSARFALFIDPTTAAIAKNFSPDPTNVGGVSALTFTISNPTAAALSGVSFSDVFPTSPGAMVVASPTGATTSGCGAATFAPVVGAGSISFSNGTVAANSSCTVKVNVTVPATGTYTNTSDHLFVGGIDTGSFATDTLTVDSAPPPPTPVCGSTLAAWTFPAGFLVTSPAPTTDNVPGTPSAKPGDGITATSFTEGTNAWGSNGDITTGTTLVFANEEYVEFAVDTTGYTGLEFSFDAARKNTPNSPQGIAVYAGTTSLATDGVEGNGSASDPGTIVYAANSTALPLSTTAFSSFGPLSLPDGTTHVRIYFFNSGNENSGSDIFVDNVSMTGCVSPSPPTISKSFSPDPVVVGGASTLTFTLSNPNATLALSGVAFDDILPAGVTVTSGSSAQCGGTLISTAPSSLSFTGGTLVAGGSCTVSISVTVTTAGPHDNVSGFVSSTEGGTNTETSGIATDSILAILPPVIAKQFAPNPVLIGTATILTFTLTNPNTDTDLTGVAFADTFPSGIEVWTTPSATVSGCGVPTFAPAPGNTAVSFSGGTIAASGTCTVTVAVTATTVGNKVNTTGAVSSTNGGTGNTGTDTLAVTPSTPAIALLKQVGPTASGPWASFLAVSVGGDVFYRFTVENTGNVPLFSVGVSDPQVSTASCSWPSPLPVASPTDDPTATCVVGPITAVAGTNPNTATASGTNGTTVTDTSTATYETTGLSIDKSVTESSFSTVGEVLHYSFLVTSTGPLALTGPITISDDKSSDESCPAVTTVGNFDNVLDAGEAITCTATYTVIQADINAGSVTNVASASGMYFGRSVTSPTDTETVPLAQVGSPGVQISKSVDPPTAAPYEPVTYTYHVCNTGQISLSNVQVTDDNGTPTFAGDDVAVGTISQLGSSNCQDLTATITPVISMEGIVNGGTANGQTVNAGSLIVAAELANGDVQATFLQDFAINDNTYGTGAIGWPASNRHTFEHLTISDKLEFRFFDKNGTKVLDFYIDTISVATKVTVPGTGQVINYPSGYGTLGPFGGDGKMVFGDKNNIVSFSTAISDNLNYPLNLPRKAELIKNSPTGLVSGDVVVDPILAPGGWDPINSFTVVVKGSAFPTGFGMVTVPDQHNSPNKFLAANSIITVPVNSTVVNTATATASTIAAGTVSATATASVSVVVPPLPSPWQTTDIGLVQAKGSASYAGGVFTVTGSGRDIGLNADEFRSVHQLASGDCSVVARVTSLENTDLFAKAAVMIRDSLNANAPEASIAVTPGRGIVFSYRSITGGNTVKAVKTGPKAPYWVKIDRIGNTFTASYSASGVVWTVLGTTRITMGAAPYIGLGVTSFKDGVVSTATFDNVTATP